MYVILRVTYYFVIDANFQKAGRLHSCLIPARNLLYLLGFFVCVSTNNPASKVKDVPTPVCFFLLYYIYSKCMFF